MEQKSHCHKKALTIDDIRQKAAEIGRETGSIVRLSDVATSLGLSRDYCKLVVNNARKTQPISWHELGIASSRTSREREILFKLNSNLTSHRAKVLAINCLLELVQEKKITPLGGRILVYAIMTGESSFERLDIPYTEKHKFTPLAVSHVLHGIKNQPRKSTGLIGSIQKDLLYQAHRERKITPREQRARIFMADCITLFREYAECRLFSTFLESKKPSIASVQLIGAAVQKLLQQQWPRELAIQERHISMLKQLIEQKVSAKFQSLQKFTNDHGLGYSAVAKLLNGSKESISLCERILRGAERLGTQPIDPLQSALNALQKNRILTDDQASLLRRSLDDHQEHQESMLPTEALALEKLFELKVLGKKITLAALGRACNMHSTSAHPLIYGRSNTSRPGCIAVINQVLQQLPAAEKRQLLDDFVPYDLKAHRQPLIKLARLRPMNEKIQQQKDRLVATISAIINERDELPTLRVKSREHGIIQPRILTRSEIGHVVNHFFGSCRGSTVELARNLSSILNSRAALETEESALRIYLTGKKVASFEHTSAIVTLKDAVSHLLPTLEVLNQCGDATTLPSAQLLDQIHDWSLIGWAQRIALATDAFQSVRLMGVFCSTRPHTLRELVRAANNYYQKQPFHEATVAYSILYHSFSTSPILLTDSSVPKLIDEALSKQVQYPKLSIHVTSMPLVIAAHRRGVTIEHFAIFLSNLYAYPRFIEGYSIIEDIARIAYSTSISQDEALERPYARRIYDRFLQRSLSGISAYTLPNETKANFQRLLELAEENKSQQTESDRRVAQLVETFFSAYSLEAVIRRYCSYLIQSPSNPLGVPYDRLLETAHDGVYEAAQRYDPDSRLQDGRPVAQFNTLAVSTIRWNAINTAKKYALDTKRNPIHLEDRVGGKDSEGTFGSLIADSEHTMDLQTEIEAEQAIKALESLPPVAKRIIELRYVLDQQMKNEEEPTLREIANRLFQERLTDHLLSHERIRQILEASLLKLRHSAFSGTSEEWDTFFASIAQHESPSPISFKVTNSSMTLAQGIELTFDQAALGMLVVADIKRIYQSGARDFEVLLRIRSEESLIEVGLFVISVEKDRVVSCERIQ